MIIPEDLAVIGFDGIPEASHFSPPLSTIQQDHYFLGQTAVQEMVRVVNANRNEESIQLQPRSITVQPALIIRDSSQFGGLSETSN
jgi:LacI family transcriptional regulator